MEPVGHHTLHLTKTVAAEPDSVFAAFTDAAKLSIWFTTKASVDLRVGGRYSNADNDNGEYLAIEKPNHLRFTWENAKHCPNTIVDVYFGSRGGSETIIRLEHSGIRTEKDVNDMRTGWSWALESVKSYLETGHPITFEAWQKQQDRVRRDD